MRNKLVENPVASKHKAELDKLAKELDIFSEELTGPSHKTEKLDNTLVPRNTGNITAMNKGRMKTTLGLKSRAMLQTSGQNTERSPAVSRTIGSPET